MNLPEKDVDYFFRLYHGLLFHVNMRQNIIEHLEKPQDIFRADMEDIIKLKEKLYSQPEIMDAFMKENPMDFSSQDLEVVRSWRNFVEGKFLIMSYEKSYAVFLDPRDPPKAYGVLGLRSSLGEMLGLDLPISVKLTLLPFKDKIIYDGTLVRDRVIYGPNMRRDVKLLLDQAKGFYGIITKLPFQAEKGEPTNLERLKLYLKNRHSRDSYYYEIQDLIDKDPELRVYYSQAMGKAEAQALNKKLKAAGIKSGWFAVLDTMVIAGGRSKEEVNSSLDEMLADDRKKHVYIFHLK